MSSHEANEYLLGTHDEELARLGYQHRVWSEFAFAAWARAGFAPGRQVLDVGCGPGFATLDIAQLVGASGRVLAVDNSPRFLAHLEARAAANQLGWVQTQLVELERPELPQAAFDGAYARWVLCFLSDPQAAIHSVARALRPGGRFAVQDYVHYTAATLAPPSPVFTRVIDAVSASWRQRGGDPQFATRLPGYLRRAGLHVREIRPLQRVARPGSELWHWPQTFFYNFVPLLVERGFLTRDDQAAFEADWTARSQDPDTFFFTPPMLEVIAEKP